MAARSSAKSATLPPRVAPPRPANQIASPSTARGFLGRIKRKLRFKNRDCEYDFGDAVNVEGVFFRRKSGEFTNGKDGTEPGNYSGRVDVSRSMSERSTSKLSKFRIGMRSSKSVKNDKNSRGDKSLVNSSSRGNSTYMYSERRTHNDYMADSRIGDAVPAAEVPLDDDEPGYETLDEVRQKMRNLKKQPKESDARRENVRTSNTNIQASNAEILSHRRCKSTGATGIPQLSLVDVDGGLSPLMAVEQNMISSNASSSPLVYKKDYAKGIVPKGIYNTSYN